MTTINESAMCYTYADYEKWDDEARYELIDGVAYMLSAPSRRHQEILLELAFRFKGYFDDKPCKVYMAPFDVRLNFDSKDDTVVQPDLLVVCDKSKLDEKGCNGAPDFIIEVASPSSLGRDAMVKLTKYMQAGVREYWVVDPQNKSVLVALLENNGEYAAELFRYDTEAVHATIFDNLSINMREIFDQINDF